MARTGVGGAFPAVCQPTGRGVGKTSAPCGDRTHRPDTPQRAGETANHRRSDACGGDCPRAERPAGGRVAQRGLGKAGRADHPIRGPGARLGAPREASAPEHIPPDLVVDQWTSDAESSSPPDFLLRHDLWTTFRRLMMSQITSTISTAWDFTPKSGGIWIFLSTWPLAPAPPRNPLDAGGRPSGRRRGALSVQRPLPRDGAAATACASDPHDRVKASPDVRCYTRVGSW